MSGAKQQQQQQQKNAAAGKEAGAATATATAPAVALALATPKDFFTEGLLGEKFKQAQTLFGKDFDQDIVASAVLRPVKDLSVEGKVSRVNGGQGNVAGILSYTFKEFTFRAEGNVKSVAACMAIPGLDAKPAASASSEGASSSSSSSSEKKCEKCCCDFTGTVKLNVSSSDFLAAGLKLSAGVESDLSAKTPSVSASAQYTRDKLAGKVEGRVDLLNVGKSTIKASAVGTFDSLAVGASAKVGVNGSVQDFDAGVCFTRDKLVAGVVAAKKLSVVNVAVQQEIRSDVKYALGASVNIRKPAEFNVLGGVSVALTPKQTAAVTANSNLDVALQYAATISDALKGSVSGKVNVRQPTKFGVGASIKYEQK